MADRTPVSLTVGGQMIRVVSSAPEAEIRRLAAIVDGRIRSLTPPGRAVQPSAMLLAAMAMASELEEERAARREDRAVDRRRLEVLLERVDEALSGVDGADDEPTDEG